MYDYSGDSDLGDDDGGCGAADDDDDDDAQELNMEHDHEPRSPMLGPCASAHIFLCQYAGSTTSAFGGMFWHDTTNCGDASQHIQEGTCSLQESV